MVEVILKVIIELEFDYVVQLCSSMLVDDKDDIKSSRRLYDRDFGS